MKKRVRETVIRFSALSTAMVMTLWSYLEFLRAGGPGLRACTLTGKTGFYFPLHDRSCPPGMIPEVCLAEDDLQIPSGADFQPSASMPIIHAECSAPRRTDDILDAVNPAGSL
ncbi:MAG: hypothetical protein ACI4W2_01410 [Eubacterium sp.]